MTDFPTKDGLSRAKRPDWLKDMIDRQSDTHRRAGRPRLSKDSATKPTFVRLTEDTLQRIDQFAGKNRRAEFIREAIDREIERRERDSPRKG